jgi:hypothetical protein
MDAALAVYGSRFPAETDAVFARRLLDQMKVRLRLVHGLLCLTHRIFTT